MICPSAQGENWSPASGKLVPAPLMTGRILNPVQDTVYHYYSIQLYGITG